jgi:PhoH-like ATPase
LVDDQIIDHFYAGEDVFIEKDEIKLGAQQFVMLVSNQNEKKTALAKFVDYNIPVRKINDYQKNGVWGLRPRNKEQQFALDLLMDENVSIVTIIGKAGSGKTLMAIASGLEQVIESGRYKKMVVSRPVEPMGKDIGFLPGTMEEKMRPWLMPIQDNLEFLMNGHNSNIDHYFDDKTIEIEALTYIRGRSISKAYIIIDEAQNLTIHELKTIITRVGEGSKIVLTGDIEQIDNVYIDSTTNGLSYAVEKFKTYVLSGHITLQKGERSKIATLAAKIL